MKFKKLNIIHVSTSLTGGAGIAAYRMHQGLIDNGVPSKMLTLVPPLAPKKEVYLFKKSKPIFLDKLKRKILGIKTKQQHNNEIVQSRKGDFEIYSFPETDYFIHEHPLIKEADIVHLHWVAGFLDFPSFFKNINKPVIWTLHDMNPFQGGFHYKEDEKRNIKNYKEIDDKSLKIKRKSYGKASIKCIVSPSKWLKEASQSSKLLGDFKHKQIYNGIDPEIFKVIDQKESRTFFELPIDKKIILFVSETLENKRKGFHLLKDVIHQITHDSDLVLIALGKIPDEKLEGIYYMGNITDELKIAKLYAASDVFVLPSLEDNLPNVMLESLLCGTPVIATPIGGMLEIIKDGFNGYIAKEVSAKDLNDALQLFFLTQHQFNRQEIGNWAKKEFGIKTQAEKYISLYKSVVNTYEEVSLNNN